MLRPPLPAPQRHTGGGNFNDVSTDLQDPPALDNPGRNKRDFPEAFVPLVQEYYPELTTKQLPLATRASCLVALEAARDMGLSVSAP